MKSSLHRADQRRSIALVLAITNGIILKYAFTHLESLYLLLLITVPALLWAAWPSGKSTQPRVSRKMVDHCPATTIRQERISPIHK